MEAPAGLGQPLHRLRKLTKGTCQAQRVRHAQGAEANGSSGLSDAKARPSIVSIHPLLTTHPPPAPTTCSPTHLPTYHLPTPHADSHSPGLPFTHLQPPINPPIPLSSLSSHPSSHLTIPTYSPACLPTLPLIYPFSPTPIHPFLSHLPTHM